MEAKGSSTNKSPQTGGNIFILLIIQNLLIIQKQLTCQMRAIVMNLRGKHAPQLPFG